MRTLFGLTALAFLSACQQQATPPAEAPKPVLSAAQTDYQAVNDRMHKAMGTPAADPDVAFMQGMIPHHQGAIEMADVALKHAKGPAVLAIARQIKAAQAPEIKAMEAWLAKRGAGAPPMSAADHEAMGH